MGVTSPHVGRHLGPSPPCRGSCPECASAPERSGARPRVGHCRALRHPLPGGGEGSACRRCPRCCRQEEQPAKGGRRRRRPPRGGQRRCPRPPPTLRRQRRPRLVGRAVAVSTAAAGTDAAVAAAPGSSAPRPPCGNAATATTAANARRVVRAGGLATPPVQRRVGRHPRGGAPPPWPLAIGQSPTSSRGDGRHETVVAMGGGHLRVNRTA